MPDNSSTRKNNNSNESIPDDVTQRFSAAPASLSASVVLSSLPTNATQVLERVIQHTTTSSSSVKVTLRLRPIGSAPSLEQSVFRISGNQKFAALIKFLRKQLRCPPSQSIFCYINNSFAPPMDEPLINLYESFAIDGHLLVSYCYTVAFG